MSEDFEIFRDFEPVPEDFFSFETGEQFCKCSLCDCDLMESGRNYLIEKAFKKGETIFEYAMCFECYLGVQETLSINSRKLIHNYFDEHVDVEVRRKELLEEHGKQAKSWLNNCMIKGTPVSKCNEYQIYGWFVDKHIVFTGMPYMLSGEVIDELLGLLSDETIGAIDDLTGKLFGLDLPKGLLVI